MATINQRVVFKNTSTKKLYRLYMDANLHGFITAGPVNISSKAGSRLNVFGGYITGRTLMTVNNKLVVQSWRAAKWSKIDPDSALILSFEQKGRNAVMYLCHANVPAGRAKGLNKGWHEHYWTPWKQYLAGRKITRPEN